MSIPERRVYTITEFAKMAGLGRSLAYALAKRNELPVPVIKLGHRYVISKAAVDALLNGTAVDGKKESVTSPKKQGAEKDSPIGGSL